MNDVFVKLLLKQKTYHIRDFLFGLVLLGIFIIAFLLSCEVGSLLLLSCLFLVSISNFMESDTFWKADDFASLNVKPGSKDYFVLYVTQKFFLGPYVQTLITGIVLVFFTSLKYGLSQSAAVVLPAMLYYFSSPACSVIYSRQNRVFMAVSIGFMVAVPCLLWLDYVFWRRFSFVYCQSSLADVAACIMFYAVILGICTLGSKFCKSSKIGIYPSRAALGFLKKIDMWLYKDYMLTYPGVFAKAFFLVSAYVLFLETDDDFGILRPFFLSIVCSTELFSEVDKCTRWPLLIHKDTLFCRKLNHDDFLLVRRKKRHTIISGAVIKFAVILPFLAAVGFTSLADMVVFASGTLMTSVLECYSIFSRRKTKILLYCMKMSIPIAWICIVMCEYSITYLYMGVSIMFVVSLLLLNLNKTNNRYCDSISEWR